jgi:hypothetical protein
MEFSERTIRIVIDLEGCETCETKACIEACATFDRGILELVDGKPGVTLSADDLMRRGTECLACEHACRVRGNGALRIEVPIPGLDEYRLAHGTAI